MKIRILMACLIGGMLVVSPVHANKMMPSTTSPSPGTPDEPPSVVLPMEAKQPGDYNFQASVNAPSNFVPLGPGKLGLLTPVILNGLQYIDLTTGLPIPPPGARPSRTRKLPPEPLPEPMPNSNLPPEPMPAPPAPQDHGRIMSVGRDPDNPGGYIVTYQDGTIERVFPPQK